MTRKLHVTALACLLLAACGSGAADETVVAGLEERRIALAGRTLVLDADNGSVTVTGRQDSTATLHFEKRARGADDEEAQRHLEGISIESQERGDTYTLRLRSSHADKTVVDVRVQVPYKTPLRLDVANGGVEIAAMAAPLTVEVGNGSVRIKGAAHHLDVRTGNGDLTVEMAGFRDETAVRLEAGNGSIALGLPASVSAAVEAETQVGAIEVRGLALAERAEEKSATGGRLRGVLGNGSGRIALRTRNGSIVLRGGS